MRRLSLLLLFMPLVFAAQLAPGTYTDWQWADEYTAPQPPQDPLDIGRCSALIGSGKCDAMNSGNSNLSDSEKRWIMLQVLANSSDVEGMHAFADEWNRNVQFTRYPPAGADVYNGTAVRNAWVSIVLLPAVRDLDNRTWVRNGTEIIVSHNVDMVVERINPPDSCDVSYNVIGYDYSLETLVDGQNAAGNVLYFGKEHGERIEIEEMMSFAAEYSVAVSVWKDEEECETVESCDDGGCTQVEKCHTEKECRYSHTEHVRDEGSVSSRRTVYFYDEGFDAASYIERSGNGPTAGWFAGAFPRGEEIEFRIGNAVYSARAAGYELAEDEEMSPYGIVGVAVASNATSEIPIGIRVIRGSIGNGMPQAEQSAAFGRMNAGNGELFVLVNYETGEAVHDCHVSFSSHFSRARREIDCGHDPALASAIDITVENVTNDTVLARARLYNPVDGLPFSERRIEISYNSSIASGVTDADGVAEFRLERTEFGSPLTARFETDLSVPGAESRIFVEGRRQAFDLAEPVVAIFLLSSYYIAWRKLRSGIGGLL